MNFCTLFDSNYLSRGLNLYNSLRRHCPSFHLYIFAFDDRSYAMLQQLNLAHATVISLEELEAYDSELLAVKPTRSRGEYCWTSTPATIKYAIEVYALDSCTYLDSDLYFYSDPGVLQDEMGDSSVLITPHRYTPRYDKAEESGIYCVQYMTFKRDEAGMKVLNWWHDACIEWCYNRHEDGKFGDQKYLDDWPDRFEGVHVLEHLGGGVAPWNIQQYTFRKSGDRVVGIESSTGKEFDLVFYHFHFVTFFTSGKVDLSPYKLTDEQKRYVYWSYLSEMDQTKQAIMKLDQHFDPHGEVATALSLGEIYFTIKRRILGIYNIHPLELIIN